MYLVKNFYDKHAQQLGLKLIAGQGGLNRKITVPEAQRPGVSLCGYVKNYAKKRILIFGKVEIEFLKDLDSSLRWERLESILTPQTPAVIIARRYRPPQRTEGNLYQIGCSFI